MYPPFPRGANKAYLHELKTALILATEAMIAQRRKRGSLPHSGITGKTTQGDLTGDLTGHDGSIGAFDRTRPALTRQQRQWELPPFVDTDDPPSRGQLSIPPVIVCPGSADASQISLSKLGRRTRQ